PFRIVKKLNDNVYEVENCETLQRSRVHIERLSKYRVQEEDNCELSTDDSESSESRGRLPS
uniref:hypothetical protein n=1 Tax=Wolbachia endosymbiont of Pentidionis agamae TaxID=3110435 RepID=UPI002FD19821